MQRLYLSMDNPWDDFTDGRRDMLAAFVSLSDLARQAGADETMISVAHGQFFDGNIKIKNSFRAVITMLIARSG